MGRRDTEICLVKNCGKPFYARGYCRSCFFKAKYVGLIENLPPKLRFCTVGGCGKKHSSKGFCEKHYRMYKVSKNPNIYKDIESKRIERARYNKKRAVDIMGGKCSICGYAQNIASLEFHHTDPSKKDHTPKNLFRDKDFDKTMLEIKKCVLVCKNCHTDIHHPELRMVGGSADSRTSR